MEAMKLPIFLLGRSAERRARRHLERKGYRILGCNVRGGRGEVDILAIDGPCLVAVEVRKRSRGWLSADLSADSRKLERVGRALAEILRRSPELRRLPWRIDLVLVDGRGRIAHFPGAG